jgi:hypothetical protein
MSTASKLSTVVLKQENFKPIRKSSIFMPNFMVPGTAREVQNNRLIKSLRLFVLGIWSGDIYTHTEL